MNSKKIGLILGMEANELRIGNYFGCDGDILQVTNINEHGIFGGKIAIKNTGMRTNSGQKYPIEITEEWLLRFGFEKRKTDLSDYEYFKFISGSESISWFQDGSCAVGGSYEEIQKGICYCSNAIINHVHQLQNLYFSLTGEELKLNEK